MQNMASSNSSRESTTNSDIRDDRRADEKELAVLISYFDGTAHPEALGANTAGLGNQQAEKDQLAQLSHIYLNHTSN